MIITSHNRAYDSELRAAADSDSSQFYDSERVDDDSGP